MNLHLPLQAPSRQADSWQPLTHHWCLQGLSKRGMDVAFLGTGSSVLAVGGLDASGANIAIWDTQAPSYHRPVARLNHHSAAVTSLQVRVWLCSLPRAREGVTSANKALAAQAPTMPAVLNPGGWLAITRALQCMLSSACDA